MSNLDHFQHIGWFSVCNSATVNDTGQSSVQLKQFKQQHTCDILE